MTFSVWWSRLEENFNFAKKAKKKKNCTYSITARGQQFVMKLIKYICTNISLSTLSSGPSLCWQRTRCLVGEGHRRRDGTTFKTSNRKFNYFPDTTTAAAVVVDCFIKSSEKSFAIPVCFALPCCRSHSHSHSHGKKLES